MRKSSTPEPEDSHDVSWSDHDDTAFNFMKSMAELGINVESDHGKVLYRLR